MIGVKPVEYKSWFVGFENKIFFARETNSGGLVRVAFTVTRHFACSKKNKSHFQKKIGYSTPRRVAHVFGLFFVLPEVLHMPFPPNSITPCKVPPSDIQKLFSSLSKARQLPKDRMSEQWSAHQLRRWRHELFWRLMKTGCVPLMPKKDLAWLVSQGVCGFGAPMVQDYKS